MSAVAALAGVLITGLFELVLIDLQQRATRDDLIRGRIVEASTRYINAMLTEEQHAQDSLESLRHSVSTTQARRRSAQLKLDLERITIAKSEIDLVSSTPIDSTTPIANYGEVKDVLGDDLLDRAAHRKLAHQLSNVSDALTRASSSREAFTKAANAALQPRTGLVGLW